MPPNLSSRPVSAEHFRSVLGHFCTGVTVVTGADADGPVGLTAQAFSALSLDPPLVLLCPSKTSTSWPRIEAAGCFCVNVLSEEQEDLCRAFATSGGDKFARVGYSPSPVTGVPLLADSLAWIDCRIEAIYEGGDHAIVVGRVLDLGSATSGKPLLFYRGGFGRFEV